MNKTLLTILAAVTLMAGSASAHDASKHKGKPIKGEIVSSTGDRFEVKTGSGLVPVTFSSKTKFEHGNATVDKTHVTKGTHVSVFGTKLPSGEMVAREVIIGTNKTASAKPVKKKASETHKH